MSMHGRAAAAEAPRGGWPVNSAYDRRVQPFQAFATTALAGVLRRQPSSPARTAFAWSVAAGPAMARAASVEARDGVLLITPKDPRWGREIERSREMLLHRVQALVGAEAITAIRICASQ